MHHHFKDIRDRIAEPPTWWDENGTPRWGEFGPSETSSIYGDQAVLLLIECQNCGTEFRVCMTGSPYGPSDALESAVRSATLHYGDPPNAGCCAAGPSMNSVPRTVLEFWDRPAFRCERRPDLEGTDLTPEWAEEADDAR